MTRFRNVFIIILAITSLNFLNIGDSTVYAHDEKPEPVVIIHL